MMLRPVTLLWIAFAAAKARAATETGYLIDKLCLDKCQDSAPDEPCAPDGINVFYRPEDHQGWCLLLSGCVESGYALVADGPEGTKREVLLDLGPSQDAVLSFIQAGTKGIFPKVLVEYDEALVTDDNSTGVPSVVGATIRDPWDESFYDGDATYQVLCANSASASVADNNLCFRSDVLVSETAEDYVIESNGCPDHPIFQGGFSFSGVAGSQDSGTCDTDKCCYGGCGGGCCGSSAGCGGGCCGSSAGCGGGCCGSSAGCGGGCCGSSAGCGGGCCGSSAGCGGGCCGSSAGCGGSFCGSSAGCGGGCCGSSAGCGGGFCGSSAGCGGGCCGTRRSLQCCGNYGGCGGGYYGNYGGCGGAYYCDSGSCEGGCCGSTDFVGSCDGSCGGGEGSGIGGNPKTEYDPMYQHYTMSIPKDPGMPGEAKPCPNEVVGILTNGVLLDSHQQTWSYDDCNGHSDKKGQYHYHIPAKCLVESLGIADIEESWWVNDAATGVRAYDAMHEEFPATSFPSPVVGFAADGFPIYALYDDNGDLQRSQDYGGSLDECNGKPDSQGNYGYYITADPPFAPPCLRGEMGRFTYSRTSKLCPAEGIRNTVLEERAARDCASAFLPETVEVARSAGQGTTTLFEAIQGCEALTSSPPSLDSDDDTEDSASHVIENKMGALAVGAVLAQSFW